jgi:hypothetical protein
MHPLPDGPWRGKSAVLPPRLAEERRSPAPAGRAGHRRVKK